MIKKKDEDDDGEGKAVFDRGCWGEKKRVGDLAKKV